MLPRMPFLLEEDLEFIAITWGRTQAESGAGRGLDEGTATFGVDSPSVPGEES